MPIRNVSVNNCYKGFVRLLCLGLWASWFRDFTTQGFIRIQIKLNDFQAASELVNRV